MLLKYDFPDEYDIEILDDDEIGDLTESKKLIIDLEGEQNAISFRKNKKSDPILRIPITNIEKADPFIQASGRIVKKDRPAMELSFNQEVLEDHIIKTIRFYVEKEKINVLIDQINYLKKAEVDHFYRKQIRIYLNPKLCVECFENKIKTLTNLCENCNLKIHGNTILQHDSAEYHGGHKAYPSGGTFRKYENGKLFLNEKSLVFIKDNKNEERRIDIIIPFSSIALGNYTIAEENTSGAIGGAVGVPIEEVNAMVGGLFRYEGKANRISIPYIDEYGILQKPVFGIPSFGGKAVRKWSHELYIRILEEKRNVGPNQSSIPTSTPDITHTKQKEPILEDPVRILKLRLAKGEITKDEYDDLVKIFE